MTERGNRAVLEFSEYLADLIDDRRHKLSHYADDVMGRLIDGLGDSDRLQQMRPLAFVCRRLPLSAGDGQSPRSVL